MRVVVTGATGFIGSALVSRLAQDADIATVGAVRTPSILPEGVALARVEDVTDAAGWPAALRGADVVVHTAARTHIMRESASDPLAEFRRVNVVGTLNVARLAAEAGVGRFVFISSVKVNGESGVFSEADAPAPIDPYGVSKHEAELALRQVTADAKMDVVIIRPPLVYGPGVRANFQALMRAVALGVPLPFGAVENRRSLVGLDNLIDFISTCVGHPAAANQTFLVSDGEDLSTPDLIRRLAQAMGKRPRLLRVPVGILQAGAVALGRRAVAQRLLGSLQVDISKARTVLHWTPPLSVDQGLKKAVEH